MFLVTASGRLWCDGRLPTDFKKTNNSRNSRPQDHGLSRRNELGRLWVREGREGGESHRRTARAPHANPDHFLVNASGRIRERWKRPEALQQGKRISDVCAEF